MQHAKIQYVTSSILYKCLPSEREELEKGLLSLISGGRLCITERSPVPFLTSTIGLDNTAASKSSKEFRYA